MDTLLNHKIEELRMKILHMAAYAERAVENAVESLFERDVDKAKKVIDQDSRINSLENDVDELSLNLLALTQPVAKDLRYILGCMRSIIDLERIGDEACNIAEKTIYLARLPEVPHNPLIEEMAAMTKEMLASAVSSFREEDDEKALLVCGMDVHIDELNVKILRKTMDDMVAETTGVRRAVNIILAARCLERIGDLSTNLAETTIFIVKGMNIKHHCRPS
jgi:phosphate transport system protein